MKYLAAYALAWLSGKASPSAKDLEAILKANGGDFDAEKANTLVESLKDKNVSELVAAGRTKLGGISTGGSAVVASAPTSAPKDQPKEDKKEAAKDDDDAMEGGIGLFDEDGW